MGIYSGDGMRGRGRVGGGREGEGGISPLSRDGDYIEDPLLCVHAGWTITTPGMFLFSLARGQADHNNHVRVPMQQEKIGVSEF
jgi:hypothetical protein